MKKAHDNVKRALKPLFINLNTFLKLNFPETG